MRLGNFFHVILGFLALASSVNAASLIDAIAQESQLSTLLALLLNHKAILDDVQSSKPKFTVLAPSNDAFTQFLNSSAWKQVSENNNGTAMTDLLSYHVLKGASQLTSFKTSPTTVETISASSIGPQVVEAILENNGLNIYSGARRKSQVTKADLTFDGGFIHIIDTVLTMPLNISSTANLMDDLSQFNANLKSTEMATPFELLSHLTIFAPTNAAFQTMSNLNGLTKDQFAQLLRYHVIAPTTIGYVDALPSGSFQTLEGHNLNVVGNATALLKVNDANIVTANVIVENGVIHIIDKALSIPNAAIVNNFKPKLTLCVIAVVLVLGHV